MMEVNEEAFVSAAVDWGKSRYSKTSKSGTPKIVGGSCHLNSATYGITYMYKTYSSNFDVSGKSVPLIVSCHLWRFDIDIDIELFRLNSINS